MKNCVRGFLFFCAAAAGGRRRVLSLPPAGCCCCDPQLACCRLLFSFFFVVWPSLPGFKRGGGWIAAATAAANRWRRNRKDPEITHGPTSNTHPTLLWIVLDRTVPGKDILNSTVDQSCFLRALASETWPLASLPIHQPEMIGYLSLRASIVSKLPSSSLVAKVEKQSFSKPHESTGGRILC